MEDTNIFKGAVQNDNVLSENTLKELKYNLEIATTYALDNKHMLKCSKFISELCSDRVDVVMLIQLVKDAQK